MRKENRKRRNRQKQRKVNHIAMSSLLLVVCAGMLTLYLVLSHIHLKYKIIGAVLVMGVALGMLYLSMHVRRRWKVNTVHFFNVVLIVITLLGFPVSVLANDGFEMLDQAVSMKTDMKDMMSLLAANDIQGAEAKVAAARSSNAAVKDRLDSPVWMKLREITPVGQDITTIRNLLDVADVAFTDLVDPLIAEAKKYPMSSIKAGEGKFNVLALNEYLDFAEKIEPKADQIVRKLGNMKLESLQSNTFLSYQTKLRNLMSAYNQAKEYVPLFRAFIGNGDDKLYLLAAQNTAEIRASGGFPGTVGTIQIDDGILSIGDFTSCYKMFSYNVPYPATATQTEIAISNGWMVVPWDAGYDPDFPRVAEIWAASMANENYAGKTVDGVISMTPAIIQKILKFGGPITVADNFTLDGNNATKVLQKDVYYKYYSLNYEGEDNSDAVFTETAKAAMSKFASSFSLGNLQSYLDIFNDSRKDRTLMMWMKDPEAEEIVHEAGLDGSINYDDQLNAVTGVYFSNNNPSKLGWYLSQNVQVNAGTKNYDGSTTYHVAVTLNNSITDEEIDTAAWYITGEDDLEGGIYGFLNLTAPVGGRIDNIEWTDVRDDIETDMYGNIKRTDKPTTHTYNNPDQQGIRYDASGKLLNHKGNKVDLGEFGLSYLYYNGGFQQVQYNGLQYWYNHDVLIMPGDAMTVEYDVTVDSEVSDPLTVVTNPTLQEYRNAELAGKIN